MTLGLQWTNFFQAAHFDSPCSDIALGTASSQGKQGMSVSEASVVVEKVPSIACTEGTEEDILHQDDEKIEILGELVGATDLCADDEDIGIPKPFAEVYFGQRKIHYSEPGEGLSPIWTIDTDSLFVLKATTAELANNSLTIKLWSSRSISPLTEIKTFLGQVHLSAVDLIMRCNGERFELPVQDELGDDFVGRGKVALRLRVATPADAKFVTLWNGRHLKETTILKALLNNEDSCPNRQKAVLVTETNESQVAGASFLNAISSAFTASNFLDSQSGTKKRRIKPNPDPKRPKSTRYLSPHEIKIETRRPSQHWVQAGSGKLGKLFVEVLACHDLPNVDVGEAIGNVTDSFVALVYEDAFVETPVIDDELSPHWLPWTQRAFCFGMMHPASMLYLGVFDYDIGPLANHEPLGRVAVNISNLQRDTVYTLRYDLFKSANVTDRTPTGQVTIRLRVEIFDEKASLMTALKPRPNIHVNVKKNKSFKVVRYTCFGEYDGEDKFDLTVIRSYINELFEYKRHLSYTITDSLQSLMFWRGQVEIFSILLPIHSMIFFCVASTLIERPHMFPAFAILSVAWLMIANGRKRHQHPFPWCRCPTFFHYLSILINGKSRLKIQRIDANEGREEAEAYEKAWRKRENDDLKRAEKRAEMQKELLEHGNENIHTQVQLGIPLDLLERLGRYQGYIGYVCRFFRQVKIILLWEESILSFWITTVFLGVGLVSLLLPWAFILTWTGRIVVYGLFGPQMKIVDLWLRANKSDELEQIMAAFDAKKQVARIRREQALKVRAIKCLRFGKLITQVPAFNLARHYDRPLPASTARLIRKPPVIEFSAYSPGQQLYGNMIPRLEDGYLKNETLALERMEKLSRLETRLVLMQAAIKIKGFRRHRQLTLKESNPTEETIPDEAGYELVQMAGEFSTHLTLPTETHLTNATTAVPQSMLSGLEPMNLCDITCTANDVRLSLDQDRCTISNKSLVRQSLLNEYYEEEKKEEYDYSAVRPPSLNKVSANKTGVHSWELCHSELSNGNEIWNYEETTADEGIEIVVCGRFEHHNGGIEYEQESFSSASLSVLYRESDSTFVAFYRSEEGISS